MKKAFVFFLCLIVLFSLFGSVIAYADDYGYYCKSEGTLVIKTINFTSLSDVLTVPKGYYVKVIGVNEYNSDYYNVEYNGVSGYIEKGILDYCERASNPEKPNFSFKLEVEATADVYKSVGATTNGVKVGDSSVYYLGKLDKEDAVYFAVKLGDGNDVYYLKESLVLNRNALNDALNPAKVPSNGNINSSTVTSDTTSSTPDSVNKTMVRVVLIVGIIVPAFIIVFLVFKPSKRRAKQQRRVDADDDSDRYDDY